jgi:hypothetical protein
LKKEKDTDQSKAGRFEVIKRVRPEKVKRGYEKLDYSDAMINIDRTKKRQWQEVHANIILAYTALIESLNGKRTPTSREVAEFCELSLSTVKNHLSQISFKPLEHPLRILTDAVIMNIYESSRNNAASQKLWMQLMEGFSENNTMDLKIKEIPAIAFVPFQQKRVQEENLLEQVES